MNLGVNENVHCQERFLESPSGRASRCWDVLFSAMLIRATRIHGQFRVGRLFTLLGSVLSDHGCC